MFYSHDLLGRKSPLGAIWTMAHGKKLSKVKILGINVSDVCKHIMQPDVPHSLRLQGILIGGVVIVFNRQQLYLLEDLQDMLRKVTAAKAPEQSAGAVVKTVLYRGRDKARVEAITLLEDTTPDMMLLPSHVLGQFEDLDDLELLEPPERQGGRADPHEHFEDTEGDVARAMARRHGGRGGRRARDLREEEEEENLMMLPTLAPPSFNEDGRGAGRTQRGGGASGGAAGPSNQALPGLNDDEVFEAPDLRVLLNDDDDEGSAFILAFGGLAAAAPTAAAAAAAATTADATKADGGRRPGPSSTAGPASLLTRSPAETGAPAATNTAGGTAAAHTLDPVSEMLEMEDSEMHFAVELPTDLHFLSDFTPEDAQQQLRSEGVQPRATTSEGQPAPSLVPLPSIGAPMDHFMPPSPVHDGEEVALPDATAVAARLSAGRDASTAVTPTDMFGRKRRRYSDEDNDSASEATGSLLAMTDQQREQLAAPDGAEDANNNNNAQNDYSTACAQNDANATREAGQRKRQQREPERPRRRRRSGGRVTLDNQEETMVAGRIYREWTLDSSALLKSRINAAPNPSASSDPGHNPGLVRASGATAAGPFADPVNGRCFTSGPYDGTPGPMICGAVAGMLAAGHITAASDAVRHGAAAMLNGSGMTWGSHLVRLVAMAAEADEVVEDVEEDVGDRHNGTHGAPRRRAAAAGEPDAGRVKQLCTVKSAATSAATASGARGNDAQQRKEQHQRQGTNTAEEDGEGEERGVMEQDLEASEGHGVDGRVDGTFHAPEAAVGEAEAIMRAMEMPADEQMQTEDDIEMERLRRHDTPEGSDMERQHRAAALGLTSLGLLAGSSQGPPTVGKSSKATSGSDESSLGRETEDEVVMANGTYRRHSSAPKKRMFGTGALEDLLPAIDEVDVNFDHELLNFMDLDEQQCVVGQGPDVMAMAAAAAAAGNSNGSGRSMGASGGGSRKPSHQSGSGARGGSGSVKEATPFLSLKETNGLTTQVPPAQLFMSRNTKVVISIFRKQLAELQIQARVQAAEQHQGAGESSDGDSGINDLQEPALSFFILASRLKRSEAVKLFYQTLVTHTAGYVVASQDEPYGDITIRAATKL